MVPAPPKVFPPPKVEPPPKLEVPKEELKVGAVLVAAPNPPPKDVPVPGAAVDPKLEPKENDEVEAAGAPKLKAGALLAGAPNPKLGAAEVAAPKVGAAPAVLVPNPPKDVPVPGAVEVVAPNPPNAGLAAPKVVLDPKAPVVGVPKALEVGCWPNIASFEVFTTFLC